MRDHEGATAIQGNELGGPAQFSEGSLEARNELKQTISRYRLSWFMHGHVKKRVERF